MKTFKTVLLTFAFTMGVIVANVRADSILFDFENANVHTPLPISLTVGSLTAQFSGTGQGFSIQRADTMGFTPAGFSGNCIYPSSVFASDLLISFSQTLTDFSILYAPQELGCDDSATMRVTAFMDGTFVGTSVTNANQPGTWPSDYLNFRSDQGFNRVVVHYDRRPLCTDYGPIFMADNVSVTLAPPPIVLTNAQLLPDRSFQFSFLNTPGASFSVFASTNLATWTLLGLPTEISPGQFQFTDLQATNAPQQFYRVRSP
jgi:hypothetical protein